MDTLTGLQSTARLRTFRGWLIAAAALVVYGSLYPFEFSAPQSGDWARLLDLGALGRGSIGDILGNIALFVPLGLLGVLAVTAAGTRSAGMVVLAAGAVALAALLQVLQVFIAPRSPAATDVVWNTIGLALGALAAWMVIARDWLPRYGSRTLVPAALIAVWAASELVPLVPSIDLQQFKDSLKPLLLHPAFSLGDALLAGATALLLGELIVGIWGLRWSTLRLVVFLVTAFGLKILMVKVDVDLSLLVGWCVGSVVWGMVEMNPRADRPTAISLFVLLALGIAALEPFEIALTPGKLHLLPFASLLEGSLLANVQALSRKIFLFAGLLWLVLPRVRSIVPVALGLAGLVLVLEWLQTLLIGRVAAVDEPLVIVALGLLFKSLGAMPAAGPLTAAQPRPAPAALGAAGRRPSPGNAPASRRHWGVYILGTLLLAMAFGLAMSLLLRLPGLPYNLAELFRDDGNFLFLSLFGLAVLWVGIGGYWVGHRVSATRWPGLVLPVWTLLVSLVSLMLLELSVTAESLSDIAGSTNVYWYVTNRDMWGPWWREVFLAIGPGIVNFLERPVRYAALYGPVAATLGLVVAVWLRARRPGLEAVWLGSLGLGLIAWLLLCKLIAFDWSSTDNLNELIARSGRFGLGGGGYLYVLLWLTALNAWLPLAAGRARKGALLTLAGTALGLPLSWLLLNQGLEPDIQKYGTTFSGVQFLLGPDRRAVLSDDVLFMRWAFAYVALTGVTAVGMWIASGILGGTAGLPAQRQRRRGTDTVTDDATAGPRPPPDARGTPAGWR